jgi:hypothetical protein
MPFTPATVGNVTPRSGRDTWNANDVGIANVANAAEATANAVTTNLNTHKASGDHDSRYYTEGEVDNKFAVHNASADHDGRYYTEGESDARYTQLTGDQSVDGVKTFVKKVVTKGFEYECLDTNGSPLARVRAGAITGTPFIKLEVYENGSYVPFLQCISEAGTVDIDRPVVVNGERLATEQYVVERVRSGSAYLHGQTANLSNGSGGYVLDGGTEKSFALPSGTRIQRISAWSPSGIIRLAEIDCDVSAELFKVYVQTTSNLTTIEIRDVVSGATLFSGTAGKQQSGIIAVTLTISI